VAVWVFDTEELAVIVAVLYIEREFLGELLYVERAVDVLDGCDDLEKEGDEEDDFVVVDEPLKVEVDVLLFVGALFLVAFDERLVVADEDVVALNLGDPVFNNVPVTEAVVNIVLLDVIESVLDTVCILEIRELTELVLVIVFVFVFTGVKVCVTELVVVAEGLVDLVNVALLVDVLLIIGERESVGEILVVALTVPVDVPLLDNVVERVDVVEPVIVLELVTVLLIEAVALAVFELVDVVVDVLVISTDFETGGDADTLDDDDPVLEAIVDLDKVGVAVFVLENLVEWLIVVLELDVLLLLILDVPVLLEVVVLEAVALPVIVCVNFAVIVNCGLEEGVLLTPVLRVTVCVLVIVFVEVPDSVPTFVCFGDCVLPDVLVEDLLLVALIVGKIKSIINLRCGRVFVIWI
jgi:hypothetical protein